MKKPKVGYGSLKKPDILKIASLTELKGLKKGDQIILKKIGLKKKIEIFKESKKLGINILNITSEFLKGAELQLKVRKDKKKQKLSEKSAKKEKAKKKAEEKANTEKKEETKEISEEEKKTEKMKEKKEKDKILTTKE